MGSHEDTFRPREESDRTFHCRHFLFLLTTEALSRLLTKEESVGNVQGIEMARGGSLFDTHLLLVDDLFLLAKDNDQNLRTIFTHLEPYQRWLGQSIKRSKSAIFSSSNMPNATSKHFCQLLHLKRGQLNYK